MRLQRLYINGFRNLEATELPCGSGFNIFSGANGQGKTNLLEAIYLLGTLKSFRHARNRDIIRYADERAMVRGSIHRDGMDLEVAVELDPHVKHPRIDGKAVERVGDFFGHLNVVLFAPDDLAMLKGQPELRRRYLDRAVFSVDLGYLRCYHDYARALKNRNALLRSGDTGSLDAWNGQLVPAGVSLARRRASFVARMAPLVQDYYRALSGQREQVTVRYLSCLADRQGAVTAGAEEAFVRGLADAAQEELRRGTTLMGPHRDDLLFRLDDREVRHHASQGQLRSLILAVKMAEIAIAEERFGAPPILLLDDLASELDRQRTSNMLAYLKGKPIQVFITTTDQTAVPFPEGIDARLFRVEDGAVSAQ